MVYYNKLRYSLMPYIYSMTGWVYFNDYTIMRPMVMDFGYDMKVNDLGDQYMFGPSLLAAPVYEYQARSREVYLPKNTAWYDFYSGTYFEGGKTIEADAPYERMPLFVKAGSIIPIGEDIQYTSEKPDMKVTLYVYAGADAAFTLYEDEGTNYDYEKGKYTNIPISYNDKTKELVIGDRAGSFDEMTKERVFEVVYISQEKAKGFDSKPVSCATIRYDGTKQAVKL